MPNLATAQGALSFAEQQRAEMVRCWQRDRAWRPNGVSYMAYLFATHDIDASGKTPLDWRKGRRLEKVAPRELRLPRYVPAIIGNTTMQHHTQHRELFAQGLKRFSELTGALGTLLLMECWTMHSPEGTTNPQEYRDTLPDDLSEAEGRREVLMMSLEHVALPRARWWFAEIHRNPDRIMPWTDMNPEQVQGRMVGFVDARS